MNRLGCRVTVIEVARGLRRGGTPVDIEGETIDILARMGMIDAVRARALPPRRLEFKDADDGTVGLFGDQPGPEEASDEKYEIHRDDLLDILFASVELSVEVVFDQTIRHDRHGAAHAGHRRHAIARVTHQRHPTIRGMFKSVISRSMLAIPCS
jgi:2-polyprenyl-6-methoxyphenol hydroxylase-like FAD-dependent oxidoreductase